MNWSNSSAPRNWNWCTGSVPMNWSWLTSSHELNWTGTVTVLAGSDGAERSRRPTATRQHLFYITCSICIPKTQKMLFKQSSFDHYKFTLKSNVHCASPLSIARVHMCYTFCAQCALEESTINTKTFETGQRSLKKIKEVCRTLNKDSAEMWKHPSASKVPKKG